MRIVLLILIICIPKLMLKAQPGCGLTCINIKEWRLAGQMVKVEIGLSSNGKKIRSFKVSETDSLVTFSHTSGAMYCKLQIGRKEIKIVIDSLNCDTYFHFRLGDTAVKTIKLIPSETINETGCSNQKSKLLIARKEN